MNENSRTKLGLISETVATPEVPLREVMRCTSLLAYCATANGSNKGYYYHIYKFMRRRASEEAVLDAPAIVWPSILGRWADWAKAELNAPARQWYAEQPASNRGHLYTDASLKGWGAILFHSDGSIHIRGAKWSDDELHQAGFTKSGDPNINVLEAMAVQRAFSTLEFDCDLHLFIDNTSVQSRLLKITSKSYRLNNILSQIKDDPKFHLIRRCSYIESHANRSDFISRLW